MRRRASLIGLAGLLLAPGAAVRAQAQPVVTSTGPDRTEVTVYRDPDRGDRAMNIRWLNGFALVSERRRVRLPAGESVVRFEGVASGIVPQSAIVTGFPDGVVERNRDAYLLSPATLIDRSLGQRVHLRRTDRATGAVREQEAVVRSGAAGAVVIESAEGVEALRCTGQRETIVYDGVPAGLSSKPTLSVRTRTSGPVEAEVTLSYLATGFDWQANYVAELSDDGDRMDLFAWLTLASNDRTSFPDADTQAVAGRVNYTRAQVPPVEGPPLVLQCWPADTTSDVPEWQDEAPYPPPAPPMAPPPAVMMAPQEIVVTGSRVRGAVSMVAQQEELGDLKLYRIPEPVTVAANGQKQVALLIRPDIPVQTVFRARLAPGQDTDPVATRRVLVTRNRTQDGLGVPLPSGAVSAFVDRADQAFLIGQGRLDDRAVGEDVEIEIGMAEGVRLAQRPVAADKAGRWAEYELTASNDQPRAVRFEAELEPVDNHRFERARLIERDGLRVWAITLPANGRRTLRYRVARIAAD